MKQILSLVTLVFLLSTSSCSQTNSEKKRASKTNQTFPVKKSEKEWKKILSPIAFEVMVKKGTEPAFSNPYNDNHQRGIYVSAASGEPLFSSDDKYDSGTGWSSFTKPINPDAVIIFKNNDVGMSGYEVIESKTGLHLGHIFNDGPKDKGGKRYCMNSAALKFIGK